MIHSLAFLFILLILFCLFKALYHLVKEGGSRSSGMVKVLAWRVGLTALFFVTLIVAGVMGWIEPHTLQSP